MVTITYFFLGWIFFFNILFKKFIFGPVGSWWLSAWFSLVAASRGYVLMQSVGFTLWSTECGRMDFISWGLVVWRHVESSGTRDPTRVACITRQILNH